MTLTLEENSNPGGTFGSYTQIVVLTTRFSCAVKRQNQKMEHWKKGNLNQRLTKDRSWATGTTRLQHQFKVSPNRPSLESFQVPCFCGQTCPLLWARRLSARKDKLNLQSYGSDRRTVFFWQKGNSNPKSILWITFRENKKSSKSKSAVTTSRPSFRIVAATAVAEQSTVKNR
jgi:hypothetical protein